MKYVPYVVNRKNGDERQTDIYSALLDERTIFVSGEINDDLADSVIAQLLFLEASDPKKDIIMYINSPGGSVTAGLAIYDTMRHVRTKVHTLCVAQACSMAAVLLASGDKRSLLPSSRVMIHQPSGGAEGKETDIVISAREITRMRSMLSNILSKHTGKSVKTIENDIERDRFMSAEEALKYGIADDILPSPKEKGEKIEK